MQKETRKKVILGLLVTLGSLLFITGIFFIGAKEYRFASTIHLHVKYRDVNGLRTGDYVRYSGVRIGVVENVVFENDTTIRVDLKIESELGSVIHRNALAYIASDGLVGNKIMEIRPGWGPATAIQDGDALTGVNPMITQEIMNKLSETNDNVSELASNLAALSRDMNSGKSILSTLVFDSASGQNFRSFMLELVSASEKADAAAKELEKSLKKISSGEGALGEAISDTVLVPGIREAIHSLTVAAENSEKFTARLDVLMERSLKENNFLQMVSSDTLLANDIRQSVKNLRQSSVLLNDNLEALRHNFLFRRYFRKMERE